MMDNYRRSWALRYLREARSELEAAKRMPYMAPNLIIEAIRKARNAIYYSLGEPAFVEIALREACEKTGCQAITDPILRFLLEIEGMMQQLSQLEEIDGEKVMKQADNLVQIASDIVEALTGEKAES